METELEKKLSGGIPKDFDSIVKLLEDKQKAISAPTALIAIPDGRSLARKNADYADPRILPALGGVETFVGYAPKNGQMEFIAWNRAAGRYEFFILEGVGSGKPPKLTKPNRALCLSCHQNGGPIFARAPWSETNGKGGFTHNAVLEKLMKEMKFKSSIPMGGSNEVTNYDEFTRYASTRLQNARICREICDPKDSDCRLRLLGAAIDEINRPFASNPKENRYFTEKLWPKMLKNGFSYPTSTLLDRDPNKSRDEGGVSISFSGSNLSGTHTLNDEEVTGSGPELIFSELLSTTDSLILSEENSANPTFRLERITGIQGLADPLTPRPKISLTEPKKEFILSGIADACFGLSYPYPNAIQGTEDFYAKLKASPLKGLLEKNWPPSQDLIVGVLSNSESLIPEACAEPAKAALPEGKWIGEIKDKLDTKANEPGAIFQKHCAECHDGFGAVVSGHQLPLANPEAMLNYKKDENGESMVLKYLRDPQGNPRMPPQSASHPLSPSDREILLNFMAGK